MPLAKDTTHHTPMSKIPVPARGQPLSKGTTNSQTAKAKGSKKDRVPQTEVDRLDFLRSKLEESIPAFIKARKELEEVMSAGGSSEQGRPISEAAAELKSELQRHRELASKVKAILKENIEPRNTSQDGIKPTNSYDFLKSIMS